MVPARKSRALRIDAIASRLDGHWQLVAGAFDVDPQRGRDFAIAQGLDPARSYGSYQDLIAGEAGRGDRVDAVAICTPNFTHYPIAKALIEAGFDVICEKPLTATLDDAVALEALARDSGRFVGVTYTYCGYPLVHEARVRVARGELGRVRTVQAEYPLEWMSTAIKRSGNDQAAWRTDPRKNGRGGSIGDIGTHAFHLAGFVTGLTLDSLTADLATFVGGRALDDNAHVMLRYQGGARGLLWSSQVAIGNSNGVRLRVFGEKVLCNGSRNSRTSWSSRRWMAPCRPSSAAPTICRTTPRSAPARPPATPRAIWKPSPTFTPVSPRRSAPGRRGANRACWGRTCRWPMTG